MTPDTLAVQSSWYRFYHSQSNPPAWERVTIANLHALGVPVRSHAQPDYVQEQATAHNKSVTRTVGKQELLILALRKPQEVCDES